MLICRSFHRRERYLGFFRFERKLGFRPPTSIQLLPAPTHHHADHTLSSDYVSYGTPVRQLTDLS